MTEPTFYFEEILDDDDKEEPLLTESDGEKSNRAKWIASQLLKSNNDAGPGFGQCSVDCVDRKLYVFGGCDRHGTKTSDTIRCYDTDTSSWVNDMGVTGIAPSPRFGHSSVTYGKDIVIFGGQGIQKEEDVPCCCFNDIFSFDTTKKGWTLLSDSGEDTGGKPKPCSRHSHTAVVTGTKMLIFGGESPVYGVLNDTWKFGFKSHEWKKIEPMSCNVPISREMHSASVHDSIMYIIGGRDVNGNVLDDIWKYDEKRREWTKVNEAMTSGRCCHTSIALDKKMFVHGGCDDSNNIPGDITMIDLKTHSIQACAVTFADKTLSRSFARFGHACCLLGNSVVIFGGVTVSADLNDIFVLVRTE